MLDRFNVRQQLLRRNRPGNHRADDIKVDVDIRRCDYQTSQILRQCHSMVMLLLDRLAARDKVNEQKDAEIKRLNEHVAELLNRPML